MAISDGDGSARYHSDPSSAPNAVPETTRHFQNVAIDLRSVIDGMSEGFALLGNDFTILDLNAEALRLESRTKNQIVGRSHWDVYPGSEGNPIGALYKLAMRERIPVSREHSHVWEDGRVSWLDMRAYPVGGDQLAIFYRDVTERHETEQKLRESEARFRCAIEGFDNVLWTNSADGRMRGQQPGWSGLTGQTIEEYRDFGWLASVHPDDAQPTIDAWNVAVAERQVFNFQHRVRRHDGQWRRCKVRVVPIVNDDHSVREWVGVHSDITDLMESETRFRQLSENIDVVFYVHEIDEGCVSYVSPAYERFWQQSPEAVYDNFRIFLDPIHPDDRSAVEQALATRSTGKNTEVRYRLVSMDGTTRYIHDRGFVTTHPDSGARRAVGIAEDVTITTQTRLQLSRNAATFESLVKNDPFGVYIVDQHFILVEVSEGARKAFAGIDPLVGRDFAEVVHVAWPNAYATEIITRFRTTLDSGETYISSGRLEQRNDRNEAEAYDWRIDRVVLPSGEFGLVCYFYDLSDRLALEANLQQALSDKDVLLYEIDHRIRNSLSMVSSLLSMQGNSSNSAEIKQALAVAAMRLQAVARIHERLYKGRVVGTVEFDIYLEEICRDLEASLGHDKTSLTLQTVPLILTVDQAVPLGLLINELVTNAFKHCGPQGAMVRVKLTLNGDLMTITVMDNGVGMPRDYDPAARTGLGTQVIEMLARQLGGALVNPKAGEAAQFEVTVPVESLSSD